MGALPFGLKDDSLRVCFGLGSCLDMVEGAGRRDLYSPYIHCLDVSMNRYATVELMDD